MVRWQSFKTGEDVRVHVILQRDVTGYTFASTLRRLDGRIAAVGTVVVADPAKGEVYIEFPRTLPAGRYYTDLKYTNGTNFENIEGYIWIEICPAATL